MKSSLKRQSSNLNIATGGSYQSQNTGMKSVKFDEGGKMKEKVFTAEELDAMLGLKGKKP